MVDLGRSLAEGQRVLGDDGSGKPSSLCVFVVRRMFAANVPTADRFWRDQMERHTEWPYDLPTYGWNDVLRADLGRLSTRARVGRQGTSKPTWRLIASDARLKALNNTAIQPPSLFDVQGRVMILPAMGMVISSDPPAVLDLAVGCCRAATSTNLTSIVKQRVFDGPSGPLSRAMEPRKLIRKMNATTIEHEWLLLVAFYHSTSYYHSLVEAGVRIFWGMQLLRSHPELKVLHASPFVDSMLTILGLNGRGVLFAGFEDFSKPQAQFARRITIPPSDRHQAAAATGRFGAAVKMLQKQYRDGLASALAKSPRASAGIGSSDVVRAGDPLRVLVVRRAATAPGGGRALLNHDEMMLMLRHSLLPPKVPLVEYPPDGISLQQTASMWA